ncbi:MAG: hypothetical protein ACU0DW_06775 [Shimia sp.]
MRKFLSLGLVALTAACGPVSIPDSGAGVSRSVDPFANQRASRNARLDLTGERIFQVEADGAASTLGQQRVALDAGAPQSAITRTAPLVAPAAATTVAVAAPLAVAPSAAARISDEQSFDAVASRESIESDAARLEAIRNQYSVVQPTALPERSSGTGPNVVRYALETKNPLGVQIYRRNPFAREGRAARACAAFQSDDAAQREFLIRGGPMRDRLGIDPDGDGFACGWNPAVYRQAQS